jgi:hypothetical protein
VQREGYLIETYFRVPAGLPARRLLLAEEAGRERVVEVEYIPQAESGASTTDGDDLPNPTALLSMRIPGVGSVKEMMKMMSRTGRQRGHCAAR